MTTSVATDGVATSREDASGGISYRKWLVFSARMARGAFPKATPERQRLLEAEVIGFIEGFNPYGYNPEPLSGWDGEFTPDGCFDTVHDAFYDHFHDHEVAEEKRRSAREGRYFIDQLACCIRAGLNAAGDNNAGVVGFTVGDLRRMWPKRRDGNPPAWVIATFEPTSGPGGVDLRAAPDACDIWL